MMGAKTCLVLGAGASAPYGLPPASALRDLILVTFVPDSAKTALAFSPGTPPFQPYIHSSPEKKSIHVKNAWRDLLNHTCKGTNCDAAKIQAFRNAFFRSKFHSIDKFLQWNAEEFGQIGRVSIATVLLACEEISRLDKDWYAQLLQDVIPNEPNDLEAHKLSIITFNYDRSFERFFLDAFEAGFRLPPERARALFNRIEIVHVYGDLGDLNEIGYGDVKLVYKAAENITLARAQSENKNRQKINEILDAAETVCFIGFSFAPENTALFETSVLKGKNLTATSLGMSGAREQEVRKAFRGIRFFDGSADELLNNRNIFEAPRVAVRKDHLPVKSKRSNWMRDVLGDSEWSVRL